MNRERIARRRRERHISFHESDAKVMRETMIKETLVHGSAREQSRFRRDGLRTRLPGRRRKQNRIDAVGREKSEGGRQSDRVRFMGMSRMRGKRRVRRHAGKSPGGSRYNGAEVTQIQ